MRVTFSPLGALSASVADRAPRFACFFLQRIQLHVADEEADVEGSPRLAVDVVVIDDGVIGCRGARPFRQVFAGDEEVAQRSAGIADGVVFLEVGEAYQPFA